ncbi:MAG TPA: hypothetical protein VKW76_05760 [Candidatus Binatia bacterium]|nr:hypothetical protein [Candidatus Binatia bacterium]
MRRALVLATMLGCGLPADAPDPAAHPRGAIARRLPEAPEQLWPALLVALAAEDVRVGRTDAVRRLVVVQWRYTGPDAARRLADLADLAAARAEGLGAVSAFTVTYALLVAPAGGGGSLLEIASSIRAVERGEATLLGGVLQPLTFTTEVPSRGTAERGLLGRLAAAIYPAEEVLLLTGEPGAD